MKKRYTEAQIIGFLKEAESGIPVKELCRKHGFSDASFYAWRSKYGGMEVSEIKRKKGLEQENARLKKLLAETMLDKEDLSVTLKKKVLTPSARRQAVWHMQAVTDISKRRACRLAGISRSVLDYAPPRNADDESLTAKIIVLAQERRRFGRLGVGQRLLIQFNSRTAVELCGGSFVRVEDFMVSIQ